MGPPAPRRPVAFPSPAGSGSPHWPSGSMLWVSTPFTICAGGNRAGGSQAMRMASRSMSKGPSGPRSPEGTAVRLAMSHSMLPKRMACTCKSAPSGVKGPRSLAQPLRDVFPFKLMIVWLKLVTSGNSKLRVQKMSRPLRQCAPAAGRSHRTSPRFGAGRLRRPLW